MTKQELMDILEQQSADEIVFHGTCHDCGKQTEILAAIAEDATVVKGGSVYKVPAPSAREDNIFIKCEDCFKKDKILRNWRKTEVYSRVVGYLRPVEQWNKGKKAEWDIRKAYKIQQNRDV